MVGSTRRLARFGVVLVGAYIVAAAFAFWPGYFSRIGSIPNAAVHIHGWLMVGWLLLLLAQASLIARSRPLLHRSFGKLSYALAPAVALSIALAAHSAASRSEIDGAAAARIALQLGYVPLFLALWGLGIHYRDQPARHARFMVCTVLPATSPVFDRVLGFYLMPQMAFLPQFPDGSRLLPAIYLLLFALAAWDWRNHRKGGAFLLVCGFFFAQHTAVLLLHDAGWWRSFCVWFAALSLA